MKPDAMIEEIPCDSAEALLDQMNPDRGRLWQRSRESFLQEETWIFRGTSRAKTYTLTPSAFRRNAFAPFREAQMQYVTTSAMDQRNNEDRVITNFCTLVDSMGIHVPSDRPELRDVRRAPLNNKSHEFPPIEKLHMAALAQHYGVPTRLLDWTRYPRIAAYFAVEQIAKVRGGKIVPPSISPDELELCGTCNKRVQKPIKPEESEPCAVWALNQTLVDELLAAIRPNPMIYFVTAPAATNPNLAAQGGLFTLVQPAEGHDPHPLPDLDDVLKRFASDVPEKIERRAPFLVKFILPASEARTALRMLAADDVHAGTVWPGLGGVVDWMKERCGAYQWTPPGQRS